MPPDAAPPDAPCPAPDLWVLGSFTMTGSALGRHAAETVASALEGGLRVLTLSFHPGAFAEADVSALVARGRPAGATGVVYLRALTRLSGTRGRIGVWRRRWRALRQIIEASDRVVLLRETRDMNWQSARLQWVLGRLMALRMRNVTVALAEVAPVEILTGMLGLPAAPVAPSAAEGRVIAHVRAGSTEDLRLTEAHVLRALRHPENAALGREVHDDLLALTRSARRLSPKDVEAALRQGSLRDIGSAPRALQAAFSPSTRWPELPRIAEHLRIIGKKRQHWARYLPPERLGQWTGRSREAVVLRHLAGLAEPGDAAELEALSAPLCPGRAALSRLDWYLMVALRCPVPDMDSLLAPWDSAEMIATLADLGKPRSDAPQRGGAPVLRITGIAGNGTGLAQNFWMSAQAIARTGLAPSLHPLDTTERPAPAVPLLSRSAPRLRLSRDVTLYHVNADRIPQEILAEDRSRTAYGIGYLLWELDRIPPAHHLALEMLDEIWVPSVFLKRLYEGRFDRDVVLMRKAVDLPEPVAFDAPPPGVRRLVVCFDQRSSIARKNPLAAVHAFADAFRGRRDVELLIKTTPESGAAWSDTGGQMRRIEEAAAADPRIRLVKAQLPFPQLLGLIATADALVSPHRAEGFGYFPAFALSLGVPVIATDHSGTQDFCTEATSFPVPAELVPVPDGQMPWRTPGARWAEIDRGALAEAMARAVDDPGEALARAERGRAVMATDYAPSALTRRYADRLVEAGLATREDAGAEARAAGQT